MVQRRRWTPPYELDLAASVARHTRWGGDPVNLVVGDTYYRVATTAGRPLPYSARQLPSGAVEVVVAADRDAAAALADMQYRLGVALPVAPLRALARRDPIVRSALRRRPGYRPPMTPDLFESLITSITAQQVNLTWATTTRRRLVERFGSRRRFGGRLLWQFPAPAAVAGARHAEIRAMQFTNAKASYVLEVANVAAAGGLDGIADAAGTEVVAALTAIRGIGRWSAEWALARCLARPEAVAAGDLGVQKAIGGAYLGRRATEDEVRRLTARWGDAANWATHLLLEGLTD
jgi:DNA-3-methyladenine glycosylase II